MLEVESFFGATHKIILFRDTNEAALEYVESVDGHLRLDVSLKGSVVNLGYKHVAYLLLSHSATKSRMR